jgi:hypothetical protein
MSLRTMPSLNDPAFEFPDKIQGHRELVVLEKGTCTYRAGQRLIGAAFEDEPEVVEARNFDEAASLTQSPLGILLLPSLAVHHVWGCMVGSEWRRLSDYVFTYTNPPLYLAGRGVQTSPATEQSCAALPNLRGLLGDEAVEWVDAENTQCAARLCQDGKSDACITNEEGLVASGLVVLQELKKMTPGWYTFEKAN